ncbi:ABC transporter permease subunit [Nocardiopsis sp. L17-MgMaSL7]|uniref:ABC transporter permease n=1 Tax=Nocardiopsis sp. L17-MgMaSL7 TaxID=1938893 RepID=UPI000D70A3CB|nr:ABC transporter permease subunit [Nocardiopsis sp. L17-MgMaSL7]PWV47374.1 carbohydrate ABC transporter membrane protein 1 (CUT1 family) [Nocardiopsis sp. L17-MgMaSL7]
MTSNDTGAADVAARADGTPPGKPGKRSSGPPDGSRPGWRRLFGPATLFLLPALLFLGVFLAYPAAYSVVRSFFDASGSQFVGLDNYGRMFTDDRTLTAIRNTGIWVLVAPALVTGLGLVFAVLTERVRWATAFRILLFMPMAISLFASGIIFRLVYDENPDRGVVNAAVVTVHDTFASPSEYPGARPRGEELDTDPSLGGFTSTQAYAPGDTVALPLVGIRPGEVPEQATQAADPASSGDTIEGVVWLDVALGGDAGTIDDGENGLPRMMVDALRDGQVVASTTSGDDGRFTLTGLEPGEYEIHLAADNFTESFRGLTWLGPTLITPVIISSWVWIMTGFAITFIAAGLAAIPRDALEAARVDGATEWQVFRKITIPLLGPLLLVVFVTLMINVLKIFDLVFVIAPGSVQADASVVALQMWQVSFGAGGNQGLGSALVVLLLVLVLPIMYFNIRRFRRERS